MQHLYAPQTRQHGNFIPEVPMQRWAKALQEVVETMAPMAHSPERNSVRTHSSPPGVETLNSEEGRGAKKQSQTDASWVVESAALVHLCDGRVLSLFHKLGSSGKRDQQLRKRLLQTGH